MTPAIPFADDDIIQQAVGRLRQARSIAVFTGAGVSAESGIPTFRDARKGLWARFNPADLASCEAFNRDPEHVSQWYDQRRGDVARCKPNPGHLALARLQQAAARHRQTFALITQNVDRLHQAAGSTSVIELHGSLWVWRCLACGAEIEERGPAFPSYPPRCRCGGLRRPAVVWFGESLPPAAWAAAEHAAQACDYFMSIGTSAEVYPAAGLIEQALRAGAAVLEINPQPTALSDQATWSLRRKSGEVLPAIVAQAWPNDAGV
jgi:NAD-dependent deacetylase